jgi:hypothetical protein
VPYLRSVVPNGHVWLDRLLLDHPAQHLSGTVGGIADQVRGLELQALLEAIGHRSSEVDFLGAVRRCGLHVQDNPGPGVDQIVSRVGIERRSAWGSRPARCRSGGPQRVELLASNVDREFAVLQHLDRGIILIPPSAHPFSGIIRLAAEMVEIELAGEPDNDAIQRRVSEIIMIQIVRFAQSSLSPSAVDLGKAEIR